ncbi:SAF domain-containing protein [Mycobacterium sp. MYCO198283]|uniref:SAF domain-containing protein n=1 Tax=Mycobacterium sp. MYCO198283 TaxID=2883505 RepID=UPI001E58B433|nr:SAF domain-containing protein [Mycobacterium sp. MYCO198283]MCG5430978.1 SAF domain-containing protein [Mycobacterium sp. MYCO198283]
MGDSLNPTALHRLAALLRPGWARTVAARRLAAAGLVLLAGVAALRADPDGDRAAVVVAARDLAPGVELTADDVRLEHRPRGEVPDGSSGALDDVLGSTVAGPARRGEVLTDVRVLGPRLAGAAAQVKDARIVPVPLPDGALTDVIRAGDVVDVLADGSADAGPGDPAQPRVVASRAVVVLVSAAPQQRGPAGQRMVLLALPAPAAAAVAGAAITEAVTVIFR